VAAKRVGKKGTVIGIDLLPMEPIEGVHFIQGDFTSSEYEQALCRCVDGRKMDVVMSDMAPNLSGVALSDQIRMIHLAEQAFAFALSVLQPEGCFVVKLFQGVGFDAFVAEVRKSFIHVKIRKPKASKSKSKEVYLFARKFRAIMPIR